MDRILAEPTPQAPIHQCVPCSKGIPLATSPHVGASSRKNLWSPPTARQRCGRRMGRSTRTARSRTSTGGRPWVAPCCCGTRPRLAHWRMRDHSLQIPGEPQTLSWCLGGRMDGYLAPLTTRAPPQKRKLHVSGCRTHGPRPSQQPAPSSWPPPPPSRAGRRSCASSTPPTTSSPPARPRPPTSAGTTRRWSGSRARCRWRKTPPRRPPATAPPPPAPPRPPNSRSGPRRPTRPATAAAAGRPSWPPRAGRWSWARPAAATSSTCPARTTKCPRGRPRPTLCGGRRRPCSA
mmetsp:Transcript_24291/g.42360  ORF Transcript_24291/g.42360 Transcript_24291/m.42360 type:complete len:291 (-) Transcript_24291:307-1179(-)